MALTRRRRFLILAMPAMLASAVAIGVVRAQTPPPPQGAPPQAEPHRGWGAIPGLRIAERLATLEVYLGITPEQMPAWRAFTRTAIAMAPDPGDGQDAMADGAFAGIDRMSARMQRMAAAAQDFDRAAQALKAVLTPEQVTRADAVWRTMQERRARLHRWMAERRGDD